MITRRTFIGRLGLGAATPILGALAGGLFNEAMGQVEARKRVVILLSGNGIHPDLMLTPADVRSLDPTLTMPLDVPLGVVPDMLASVSRYRDRMLLIDGLTNRQAWGHTAAYAALSGFSAANGGSNEHGGAPGGITIDQYLGAELGKNTPFKSILFGCGAAKMVFASGSGAPEAAFTNPSDLYRVLFGSVADPQGGALRQQLLLDSIRGEVKNLERALAPSERIKLQHVTSSIEALDQRARTLAGLSCAAPLAPTSSDVVEDNLEAMAALATIALICGMTQVVGISAGCGPSHAGFPNFTRATGAYQLPTGSNWAYVGHDGPDIQGPAFTAAYNYLAGILGTMADELSLHQEGDATIFDNTSMTLMSDNADQHHSDHLRWPVVLLGSAGGRLKANGRFIRYPARERAGYRALVDYYSSLAYGAGIETTFGLGGSEQAQGPLPELV